MDVAVLRDDGFRAHKVCFLRFTRAELTHDEIVSLSLWACSIVAIPSLLDLKSYILTSNPPSRATGKPVLQPPSQC